MKHEEEMARAEKLEVAARQAFVPTPKPKPKDATSYFEMSQHSVGMDNNSHAFLVGSGGVPPLPAPCWSDPGLEPPLNEDINWMPPTLTVAHGGSANLPPQDEAPTDEEEQQ